MFEVKMLNPPIAGTLAGAAIQDIPTNPIDSDVSTAHTLRIMAYLARRDSLSLRPLAYDILNGCTTRPHCLQAIWYWVNGNLTFRAHEEIISTELGVDGIDKQLLIPPADLLRMQKPEGDCAIYATFTASLMLAAGLNPVFRTTASDKEEPWRFSHVYVVDRSGYVMDTSHGKYPGWETQKRFRQMDFAI